MFLNRAGEVARYRYDWRAHNVGDDLSNHSIDFGKAQFAWKDLWSGEQGNTKSALDLNVPAHSMVLLRLSPVE